MAGKLLPQLSLVVVVKDVTNDTRDAGQGDIFRDVGPDGQCMRFVTSMGMRTSVPRDVLYDLDPRDWPPHSFPARIVRAIELFEKMETAESGSISSHRLPSLVAKAHLRLQCFRQRRLTSTLTKLQADFAGSFYEEAASEVGMAIELLNMSHAQRREYRMLPRYFCKHLGQAFLAWSRAHPAVALPSMAVALQ